RGVPWKGLTNPHVMTPSCPCLSEDFADILATVADVARNAAFPQEEIDKRRGETITTIRQDQDNPGVRAGETLQALLYGDTHPYGRPGKGTIEPVERFTRAALVAYHALRFSPASALIIIAGDVRTGQAFELVERAFGDWQKDAAPERSIPPVPRHEARQERRI